MVTLSKGEGITRLPDQASHSPWHRLTLPFMVRWPVCFYHGVHKFLIIFLEALVLVLGLVSDRMLGLAHASLDIVRDLRDMTIYRTKLHTKI